MTTETANERRYTTVDKSQWNAPAGPWQDEPDKVQWTDAATGYPCLVVRNHGGALCGYVGVTEGHPLFGKDYSERLASCDCTSEDCYEHTPEGLLNVHGGITYADHCQDGSEATAICHVPEPGQPDHVWWFGFDTAHAGDITPKWDFTYSPPIGEYRTLEYVQNECASLAAQLKALEHS